MPTSASLFPLCRVFLPGTGAFSRISHNIFTVKVMHTGEVKTYLCFGNFTSSVLIYSMCIVFILGMAFPVPAENIHKTEPSAHEIVARIGDRTITREAVDLRIHQISQKRRNKPTPDEIEKIIDQMVEQTLFAEEARSLGLDKDPKVQLLLQETVDKMLANLYVYRHLMPKVQVSEKEVAAYYQTHQKQWIDPEAVHARHILLRVQRKAAADEIQAVEARALEVYQRLKNGEDFIVLANRYSQDTGTKDQGGDLGFFTRKGKVGPISDTAFALKDNEISEPVRSSVGYHILQTLEHRPQQTRPLEAVSGEIRTHLLREKRLQAAQEERKLLEKKYHLEMTGSGQPLKEDDGDPDH